MVEIDEAQLREFLMRQQFQQQMLHAQQMDEDGEGEEGEEMDEDGEGEEYQEDEEIE